MAKNRYKNSITREISGQLKVLEAVDKKLYRVELWLLNSKVNRNNWQYVNLKEHLSEVRNIPILTAYVGNKVGDGHNYDIRYDENGKEYASFTSPTAERIVGWIPADSSIEIRQDKEGVEWIVAVGYLWRWYAPELTEKIARQGGMEISVETLIHEEHKDGEVDVEDKYTILGITVLGDNVAPAVAGAKIQNLAELTALRKTMKTEIIKAASYAGAKPAPDTAPETQKSKRNGVKKMPLSKTQRKELEAKFEGYTVVGASPDGMKVALLNAHGESFGYAFTEADNGVVATERIHACSASCNFVFEGCEISVALDEISEKFTCDLTAAQNEIAQCKELSAKQAEEIAKLNAALNAHRKESAHNAAMDEFNKFNASAPEGKELNESILKDLKARIDNNEFNSMLDENGLWTGADAIRKEVQCCAALAYRDMNAEDKKSEKKFLSFGQMRGNDATPTTIGEKLSASK